MRRDTDIRTEGDIVTLELSRLSEFYICNCRGRYLCHPCFIVGRAVRYVRAAEKQKQKLQHGCYDAYCKECDKEKDDD